MTDVSPEALERIEAMVVRELSQGNTEQQVRRILAEMTIEHEVIDKAFASYRARVDEKRSLSFVGTDRTGGVADYSMRDGWYTGPGADDERWPALRQILLDGGFPPEAVDSLDESSTKVVSQLGCPWRGEFRARGLVLGYVQSGKTSNYTSVIAKAADAGYRLIIVLSGMHNNLRRQTQVRLDSQLVEPVPEQWVSLTNDLQDFGTGPSPDGLLSNNSTVLIVTKKNKSRLERIEKWLASAKETTLQKCPILVIDDEADQGGVNTGGFEDRSTLNRLLVKLLDKPALSYVGYTATPFANLFIDPSIPEDLYPRDFVVDLPRSAEYFGSERIFGRQAGSHDEEPEDGEDMVRLVAESDIEALQPPRARHLRDQFLPDRADSLDDAVRYFVLATAARWARGQREQHSSMLVHTTVYIDAHELFRVPVQEVLDQIRRELDNERALRLQQLWNQETARVPAEKFGETKVEWADLVAELPGVLDRLSIVVDNSASQARLTYDEGPVVAVVIGGNTLSRGLTLEGLTVSLFIRSANAYDTLLQMGRWFGYRRGYADLPRIWMTAELNGYFRDLAAVEHEIRNDVRRYEAEGLTPLELAVRVRTHPTMAITSAMKMQHARDAQISFSGSRNQTIHFDNDADWLRQNLAAGSQLLTGRTPSVELSRANKSIFADVPVDDVLRFFDEYNFHEEAHGLRADLLRKYIEGRVADGELHLWNIAVLSKDKSPLGQLSLGGADYGMINRSRMKDTQSHLNIKALMSKPDRVADLVDVGSLSDMSYVDLAGLRDERTPDPLERRGLLALYPVSKDSLNTRKSLVRAPLEAVENLLGVGIVFPSTGSSSAAVNYKSADLSGIRQDTVELDPEELDDEDSTVAG